MKKTTNKKKNNTIKSEKQKIENIKNDYSNIFKNITIACCIIIILCLFYFLTVFITKKNSNDSTDSKTSTEESGSPDISYTDTIVGKSFSLDDGEYLVIYYDKSDQEINSSLMEVTNDYSNIENHLDIYSVDMSDGLNKKYVSDQSNTNPKNASEIKINGPTLIKFNNGSVQDYVEGVDSIKDYLL